MQTPLTLPLPPDLPSFREALSSLNEVSAILYHGLEQAAFKTSEFAKRDFDNKHLDAGLVASVLRAHTIEYLREAGLDAQEDGCHWKFNKIPFYGISFYYKDKHVRVLKGPDGMIPGCGRSHRKKRFYNQVPSLYLVGTETHRTTENYIVLWDIDGGYTLRQLWLALPAVGAARSQDVRVYWIDELPHPGEAAAPITAVTPIAPAAPAPAAADELDDLVKRKADEDEQEKPNVR